MEKALAKSRPKRLETVIMALCAIALGVVIAVFVLYFSQFGKGHLATDQSTWGQFGDFVGGTLNPILSFLAFTILSVALLLQARQLEASRQESEETRLAGVRASAATARQIQLLERSLRLIAVNQIVSYADSWTSRAATRPMTTGEASIAQAWRAKQTELSGYVEALYQEVLAQNHNSSSAEN